MAKFAFAIIFLTLLDVAFSTPQGWGGGGGGGGGGWGPPGSSQGGGPPGQDPYGNNGNNNNNPSSTQSQALSASQISTSNRILAAHAIMAVVAWMLFMPSGGMMVRLGAAVRLHAAVQSLGLLVYLVAAALGVWMAQQFSNYGTWQDPHPILGLLILVVALVQPCIGSAHHRAYKKRAGEIRASGGGPAPGRTLTSNVHVWIGRGMIALALVNGGLGVRLASRTNPSQSAKTSTDLKIIYGVLAGSLAFLYCGITVSSELNHKSQARREGRRQRMMIKARLPTYDESEESVDRVH